MFTGLIRYLGVLRNKESKDHLIELEIENKELVSDHLQLGDSVAVNGICLTVVAIAGNKFKVQAVSETQDRTTVIAWQIGQLLNLERPISMQSFLDGHLVTGHVDGVATITAMENRGQGKMIRLAIPKLYSKYIAEKGSVTLDGISLTVAEKRDDYSLTVAMIPHTFEQTAAQQWQVGSRLHLEVDLLARYLEALMLGKQSSDMDKNFLTEHGFY